MNHNLKSEQETLAENTPLVVSIAYKYRPIPPLDHDDLIAVGMYGLMKAYRAYEPQKGAFSTIASTIIHREIIRELNKHKHKNKLDSNVEFDIEEDIKTNIQDYLPEFLTDEDRNILYLRFHLNYTFKQIGDKFGRTKQWASLKVINLLYRIRESNEKA